MTYRDPKVWTMWAARRKIKSRQSIFDWMVLIGAPVIITLIVLMWISGCSMWTPHESYDPSINERLKLQCEAHGGEWHEATQECFPLAQLGVPT